MDPPFSLLNVARNLLKKSEEKIEAYIDDIVEGPKNYTPDVRKYYSAREAFSDFFLQVSLGASMTLPHNLKNSLL